MTSPRVAPGTRREIGRANFAIARLLGLAAGGGPPNVFTTLARHPAFRKWLRFAGALMPGGRLPRADSELVILRVAHNCDCEYEWQHHERLGLAAGLTVAEIDGARQGPEAPALSPRQKTLLRAADELHATRTLSDAAWAELRGRHSEVELIELCLLVGHYEMLAMTLNALAVQPDSPPQRTPPRMLRALQSMITRRQGAAR